jgi:hypothetical protein
MLCLILFQLAKWGPQSHFQSNYGSYACVEAPKESEPGAWGHNLGTLSVRDLNTETWSSDRLCGPVVRVPGYRSRGPDSIPGTIRFSDKWWVCNGVHSASWEQFRSYLEEKVEAPF